MKRLALLLTFLIPALLSSQSCLQDGIEFTTQEQIDNFQTDYPGCTEIEGDVLINGDDITNLDGLSVLTTIGGNVQISSCYSLNNLAGLESLTTIGGDFTIRSNDFTNLTGLENLTSIGGSFNIGLIPWVSSLFSLAGLDNLTTIGGSLSIVQNVYLISLTGLENIEANSIENLIIRGNPNLGDCDILSICNYLANPSGTIEIWSNAPGCESIEEVEEACETVSINEISVVEDIIASPNPFTTTTTIEYELDQPSDITIHIYNHLGELVDVIHQKQSQGEQQVTWNAESQPAGIYYFRLKAGEQVATGKLILMK